MTREELFDAWAPEGVEWCAWTKPVLFAQWPESITPAATDPDWPDANYLWLPQASGRTVLVIDLPAVESVRTGIAFARRGYRPVPLFNTSHGPSAVIEIAPLMLALAKGGLYLKTFSIAPTAPAAFLLDADRMHPPTPPSPGKFDNRWVVFPQDFPSATLLRARGVSDVLLIHNGKSVQEDLAHVLLRWQQGGLRLLQASPSDSSTSELTVTRPSWFRQAWYRALAASRLRRNNAGGFGAVIPVQSSGGGGRYYGYG
jgi:hypothetical protein